MDLDALVMKADSSPVKLVSSDEFDSYWASLPAEKRWAKDVDGSGFMAILHMDDGVWMRIWDEADNAR